MNKKNTLIIPEQKTPDFYLPAHTITWERDLTLLQQSLEKEDLTLFLNIHEFALDNPKKSKERLEGLYRKYPGHPEILNLYSFLYLALRKVKKGNQLIVKNYELNPDYLYAKINFADLCIRKKDYDQIPKIFKGRFNLKELYPEKKTFHVSAFRGFMVMMGFYHLALGKKEKAICYHYLAHRVDPHHPNTKILEKKLYYTSFFKKIINKIKIYYICI